MEIKILARLIVKGTIAGEAALVVATVFDDKA